MSSTAVWMTVMVSIIGVFVLVGIYNRVMAMRQRRKNAFVDVDTQLKMRYDLIPNLVTAVKPYAANEKAVLDAVTAARTRAMQGGAIADRIKAEQALGASMTGLFALAEKYPPLKTDTNFRQFQADLSDAENKVATARRLFNSATSDYNDIITHFPGIMVARVMGLNEEPFFETEAAQKPAVKDLPKAKTGT